MKYVAALQDLSRNEGDKLVKDDLSAKTGYVQSKCGRARGTERCKEGSFCVQKFSVAVCRMPGWCTLVQGRPSSKFEVNHEFPCKRQRCAVTRTDRGITPLKSSLISSVSSFPTSHDGK